MSAISDASLFLAKYVNWTLKSSMIFSEGFKVFCAELPINGSREICVKENGQCERTG